jgi:hypothetical protein
MRVCRCARVLFDGRRPDARPVPAAATVTAGQRHHPHLLRQIGVAVNNLRLAGGFRPDSLPAYLPNQAI